MKGQAPIQSIIGSLFFIRMPAEEETCRLGSVGGVEAHQAETGEEALRPVQRP